MWKILRTSIFLFNLVKLFQEGILNRSIDIFSVLLIKVLNFAIDNIAMSGIEKIAKLIKKDNTDKLG